MLYLIKKEISDSCLWGIWRIDESREQLLSMLTDHSLLDERVFTVSSLDKQVEKLAVRVLLKNLLGHETNVQYCDTGRPYLPKNDYNVGISHTKNYVAVVLDKEKNVSIDIEKISDKVKRVRSKFISDNEYISSDHELIHLLLHWSAKESIYKAIGRSGTQLKEQLRIYPFEPTTQGTIQGQEFKTEKQEKFKIQYLVTEEFVLTRI